MGDKEKLPWCFLNNGPSISFKTAPNKLLASPAYAIVPTEIHIAFFKSFHKKELHREALNDPPFRGSNSFPNTLSVPGTQTIPLSSLQGIFYF